MRILIRCNDYRLSVPYIARIMRWMGRTVATEGPVIKAIIAARRRQNYEQFLPVVLMK